MTSNEDFDTIDDIPAVPESPEPEPEKEMEPVRIYFDPEGGGFYRSDLHGENIPKSSVQITEDLWQELLAGQESGKAIQSPDNAHALPWLGEPPKPTLDETKATKKAKIDANTARIRDRDGLSYAGERFDMRDTAMLKWTGLIAAKDMLPYPMTILTIDDKPFVLADQTALMQFAAAVLSYETSPDSPLTTGRSLRARVEAAETIEEVEAIVDDRE